MKAVETFHTEPWRHNCAQAVAHRWSHLYSDSEVVARYSAYGGGRAPEGCCGALFAAMNACPDRSEQIRRAFVERVGAERCRDIKGAGATPCARCVAIADALVEEMQSRK